MVAKKLKHKFVSAIADGADGTQIRPSNWNDEHDFWLGYRTNSGTTDNIVHADHASLIEYTNAGAVSVTLEQPFGGTVIPAGWWVRVKNAGVGTVSVDSVATINGSGAALVLDPGEWIDFVSDGVNYRATVVDITVKISGTPTAGQLTQWVDNKTIQGINDAGRLVLINSQTIGAAVANVDFTSGIDATYDEYQVHFHKVATAVDGALGLRISQDAGATWKAGASDYMHGAVYTPYSAAAGGAAFAGSAGVSYGQISGVHYAGGAQWVASGIITVFDPAISGIRKSFFVQSNFTGPAAQAGWNGWTCYAPDYNAINGFRFINTAGNLNGGTFKLYGVKK